MKYYIVLIMGILMFPFLQSCDDGMVDVMEPVTYNAKVKDEAILKLTPNNPNGVTSFLYNKEIVGGKEYWGVTTLNFDLGLDSDIYSLADVSKIEVYAFVEEQHGANYKYLGGNKGKLIQTIANPSPESQLVISKDEVVDLYKNEFSVNHNGDIIPGDLIELKWVITGKDGSVLDTRTNCQSLNCTYGFDVKEVQVAPDIWGGTYNYEWIDATPNAISYGKISIGQTGTVTMNLQPNSYTIYDVSHLSADYFYGGPGVLTYDYASGLVEVAGKNDQKWNIINVDGPTITIEFSYYYSAGYDEYGTFTLTRTDGTDWPENIHT